jgi:hypothetical protein
MQNPDKVRPAPPSKSADAECCTELKCESGLRNNYFEGKRLTPDMFRIEQRYLNDRRHLLNRAIHGWGVVYGYAVGGPRLAEGHRQPVRGTVSVRAGLALDQCGRELLEVGGRDLTWADLIKIDDDGRRADQEYLERQAKAIEERYRSEQDLAERQRQQPNQIVRRRRFCGLLRVHYAEQHTDPVTLKDPCRCEQREWDHACETVRYSIQIVPCDECCDEWDCELLCGCGTGPCCDELTREEIEKRGADRQGEHLPFRRGGCRCLCDHLTGLNPGKDCPGRLCDVDERCGTVRVDIGHGVRLACLELVPDGCGGIALGDELDACGPRRLVKRNDLLFDLIRGCDLTRITEIGWSQWHRQLDPVPFDDFSGLFGKPAYNAYEYITDFSIRFSRAVRAKTLQADCVSMTIMSAESEGDWRQVQRVPVVRLEYITGAGQPAGLVVGARFVIAGEWVEDALRGRASVFFADTWVEIEVRGDFILDCNGQPVDANAVGLLPAPTGNGTPGGTFVSTFRVARQERPAARPAEAR